MPHMISVDQAGHIWLTDVGLHQVFKYDAQGKLLLTLGKRLEPGSGSGGMFCKPTQVSQQKQCLYSNCNALCTNRHARVIHCCPKA